MRTAITKVGETPPLEAGEQIVSKTIVVIDPSKVDDEDPSKSDLAKWLNEQIASFHEMNGVIERFARNDPEKLPVEDIDARFKQLRGRGWGRREETPGTTKIKLTMGDMIDLSTLSASFLDHVAVHEWYIRFRKKHLNNCLRYAREKDFTIQHYEAMNEKLIEETAASIPKPTALTATANKMIDEAQARPDQLSALLTKTLEAKEALFQAMAELGTQVHEFKETTDRYAKDLHAFKSSAILDLAAAKREMADIRKFFLEKDHVTEIDRLKEFIGLCERLRELKRDGTLDAISDAILKLEGV